jgi:hypothetical protein
MDTSTLAKDKSLHERMSIMLAGNDQLGFHVH